ncbi:MAG: hypothetical protein COX36_01410 [Candidatus Nealsonbacteria bacterium CG23_combo_of_CG06-09_8_20_14_all_38_19]|uniref:DUF4349 domain-containing protein n=1 Tax=Candidatus Nealsonbacteria bacterium CG23_combo_of_CG06-09_8_20_14_all_38_19 TaxID=1974721 RepID=A0A2G9YWY0_9BACT|nr:MAG: hypothetical protein COX36_01410 [Candidatus Nealsonbacteria bacterium CG23_combo_of_CG06-09_8_20_14_all_38_19]
MLKKILVGGTIVIVVLLILSTLLVSVNSARNKAKIPSGSYVELPSDSYGLGDQDKSSEQNNLGSSANRLVVRTGKLQMVVKDISGVVNNIVQYVEGRGGWVVSSDVTKFQDVPSGSIVVRVPSASFDESINYLRGLAEKVTHESTSGQDITEEYTDLQSRLRNLEATEAQLLKLMEKSGSISDILSVQNQLTSTRGQIEQIKGRMQYLEGSAEMATITVNLALSEDLLPIPPTEKWRPEYVLKQAWRSLLGSLKSFSYLAIWIIVYAVIWFPAIIIIRFVKKFLRRNKA